MSFDYWLQTGMLVRHQATVSEVQKLLGLVERELGDASVSGLSDDGRFMHAYDAAFQLCTLALHVSGYKVAKGKGHHATTINTLPFSLGPSYDETTAYLSVCATKRNHSLYDYAGVVQANDADDLVQAARKLRDEVLKWLRTQHENLLPRGY